MQSACKEIVPENPLDISELIKKPYCYLDSNSPETLQIESLPVRFGPKESQNNRGHGIQGY